jgi:hypothetical protein
MPLHSGFSSTAVLHRAVTAIATCSLQMLHAFPKLASCHEGRLIGNMMMMKAA